ncbi:unnamed protein product, partial [Effrenium voratum]
AHAGRGQPLAEDRAAGYRRPSRGAASALRPRGPGPGLASQTHGSQEVGQRTTCHT